METVHLEVSEITHERKHLIAVGTSNVHVTDQPSRGSIYIFDVIPVVPEPDRPETDRRLKLIAKEDVKGAVTALCEIGTQGFLMMAQGQKCMVRGLKEDGSLLPVAFMDMMCYVSVTRCLPGTGLSLMGDAVKGMWLVGYMVCIPDCDEVLLYGHSQTPSTLLHRIPLSSIRISCSCHRSYYSLLVPFISSSLSLSL